MCLLRVITLNPALPNALTALSAETSVKSTSGGDLYLIDRGALCLFLYHLEVRPDGVLDVIDGLVEGVALAVAAREGGTVYVIPVFGSVDDNGVCHD